MKLKLKNKKFIFNSKFIDIEMNYITFIKYISIIYATIEAYFNF
jgi:hypothetical protein